MHLDTLTVDPAEAEAKVTEYESVLSAERTAEDSALLMAYRAARRGLPLIRLSRAVQAGGFFGTGLPKIAVSRASNAGGQCYARWDYDSLVYADRRDPYANRGAAVGRSSVRVPVAEPPDARRRWSMAATVVPIIPPHLRPRERNARHRHILWEVEDWAPVPPVDPALIRHLRGDLWIVLATWDLTELERYVLTH